MSRQSLLIIALFFCAAALDARADSLIPYGAAAGDYFLGTCDDCGYALDVGGFPGYYGSGVPLNFASLNFKFYGKTYSDMYIDNNGLLSFTTDVESWYGVAFPLPLNRAYGPLIAPYWGDVDTRGTGTVWYREDTSPDGYQELVVTWAQVGSYSQHTSPTNTFQVVLESNGTHSFVTFNSGAMGWLQGDLSYGVDPGADFDAGDGIHSYNLPGSGTAAMLNLNTGTNYSGGGVNGVRLRHRRRMYSKSMTSCSTAPTPEPATFLFAASGLMVVVFFGSKRIAK